MGREKIRNQEIKWTLKKQLSVLFLLILTGMVLLPTGRSGHWSRWLYTKLSLGDNMFFIMLFELLVPAIVVLVSFLGKLVPDGGK